MIQYALTAFIGFFAIMNPIANTPIFLGLVENENSQNKKKIAGKAALTAFIIVTIFIVAGKYIFELFGITIPAFKITGGILILFVGFEMLMSKKSSVHSTDNQESNSDIAISPLAIPILAGPGTIVTAMNNVTDGSFVHVAVLTGVFLTVIYLNYLAFSLSDIIVKKIGNNIIAVVGKLMGLMIAIMGTDMIINGIKLAFT